MPQQETPGDVPGENHEHVWGPVEKARFTGNPHRKCRVAGCSEITLDLDEEDNDGD